MFKNFRTHLLLACLLVNPLVGLGKETVLLSAGAISAGIIWLRAQVTNQPALGQQVTKPRSLAYSAQAAARPFRQTPLSIKAQIDSEIESNRPFPSDR